MGRKEGLITENRTYTDLVLNVFRGSDPYTFFSPSSVAAHIESIPMQNAEQAVRSSVFNLRKWKHLNSTEAILSVFGTQGYIWTPDLSIAQSCQPSGFRSDVFYGYTQKYQIAFSYIWNDLKIVDVVDDQTAEPRIKDSVYQDTRYFAEHVGQNISLDAYADVLERDIRTAHRRIRMMANFIDSVPESGLKIVTSRGFAEFRLDLKP